MNTADRQLMQQALDALNSPNFGVHSRAILALQERLAHCDRCGKKLGGEGDIHTCTPDPIGDAQSALIAELAAQPEQEPVAGQPLPCPFCGHIGLDFSDGETYRWGVASCGGCGASCGEVRREYPDKSEWHTEAIAEWNRRSPAAPVQEQGWILVPVTLTNDMTSAMADALEDPNNERSSWDLAENMWQAMLPKVPTPPAASMTEFEEAVAAVDNTLHYAIDHWQDRALKAEAKLAQPEQEPYGWVQPNPSFNSGIFNLGSACPSGWVGSAIDVYTTPPAAQQIDEAHSAGYSNGMTEGYEAGKAYAAAQPAPVQEPVHQWREKHSAYWYDGYPDNDDGGGPYETRTLYTTPPAAQRKPQYNKTEMNCFVQNLYDKKMREGKHGHYESMFHVVHRAIEAAHGIKENT